MSETIWTDLELPNYGKIRVSNDGRVFSYKAKKELYHRRNQDGYICIRVKDLDYHDREYKIHRLVAMAFVPNPENKPEVNHIDNVRSNNLASNLEWVTRTENIQHAHKFGNKSNLGTKNPRAKLDEDLVREIRALHDQGESVYSIANRLGRGWQTINHVVKRTSWGHVE